MKKSREELEKMYQDSLNYNVLLDEHDFSSSNDERIDELVAILTGVEGVDLDEMPDGS